MSIAKRPPWIPAVLAMLASLALLLAVWFAVRAARQRVATALNQELVFQKATGEIARLDEVLRMSAVTYAATGDAHWRDRYLHHVDLLNAQIHKVCALAPELFAEELGGETQAANQALLTMEREALELVVPGQHEPRDPHPDDAILGFADLLARTRCARRDAQRHEEAAGTIRRNAQYLLRILNDILDMSKIEAGGSTWSRSHRAPSWWIERGRGPIAGSQAQGKGIELKAATRPPMPRRSSSPIRPAAADPAQPRWATRSSSPSRGR